MLLNLVLLALFEFLFIFVFVAKGGCRACTENWFYSSTEQRCPVMPNQSKRRCPVKPSASGSGRLVERTPRFLAKTVTMDSWPPQYPPWLTLLTAIKPGRIF